jgi:hypothetical protein
MQDSFFQLFVGSYAVHQAEFIAFVPHRCQYFVFSVGWAADIPTDEFRLPLV